MSHSNTQNLPVGPFLSIVLYRSVSLHEYFPSISPYLSITLHLSLQHTFFIFLRVTGIFCSTEARYEEAFKGYGLSLEIGRILVREMVCLFLTLPNTTFAQINYS